MSRYELEKLSNIVKKATKAIHDNELFSVDALASKAAQLAQHYPHDACVVGCSGVLKKRASGKDAFISRAELKNIYQTLYCANNKFAHYFKEELGLEAYNPVKTMTRSENEGSNLVANAYEKLADSLLAEQLESALSGKEAKLYTAATAQSATKACARELNSFGVPAKKIAIAAGQSDVLLCQASYNTPKGNVTAIIPVEIKNDVALSPTMFLTVGGFVDLNKENVVEHLNKTAGRAYKVDAQELLSQISDVKNGVAAPMSDIEKIVMKTASSKGTAATHLTNNIIMQEVQPEQLNVKVAEVKVPKEAQAIADMLVSNAGAANFKFGKRVVEQGRQLIMSEMKHAGYNGAQVAVSNNTDDTISYAVSVDGQFGFMVPAKVSEGKVALPPIVVSGGRAFELNATGLSALLGTGETNSRAVAETSSLYGARPSELVERVRTAMKEQNYFAAEDALHVLKHTGDDVAFKAAFDVYTRGLRNENVEEKMGCDAPVKLASSKHLICSHTGLPAHSVYKDEHGKCRPAYRKQMSESSEGGGVSFIHSRIYFE